MVASTSPANGSTIETPATLSLNFNREPLADSVDAGQFELLASGGDASFSDGNETAIALPTANVSGATISFDLSAVTLDPDTYRLRIDPDGAEPLTDSVGVVLDGDNDGNPGGDCAPA